jgi:hypothetical protein
VRVTAFDSSASGTCTAGPCLREPQQRRRVLDRDVGERADAVIGCSRRGWCVGCPLATTGPRQASIAGSRSRTTQVMTTCPSGDRGEMRGLPHVRGRRAAMPVVRSDRERRAPGCVAIEIADEKTRLSVRVTNQPSNAPVLLVPNCRCGSLGSCCAVTSTLPARRAAAEAAGHRV